MLGLSQEQLIAILTSGAVVAACAFIFRVSGRIITDSKPYRDDSDRTSEAVGPFAVLCVLSTPFLVSLYIFGYIKLISLDTLLLFALSVLNVVLVISLSVFIEIKNDFKDASLETIRKNADIKPERWASFIESKAALGRIIIMPVIMILATVILVIELRRGNLAWIAIFVSQYYLAFMLAITVYTVMGIGKSIVNIRFSNGDKPLVGVRLLRVNSGDVRIRDSKAVYIINRALISRIEYPINPKLGLASDGADEIKK